MENPTLQLKPEELKLAQEVFECLYPNFEFSLNALFKEMLTERAIALKLKKQENSQAINYAKIIFGIDNLNKNLEKFLSKETDQATKSITDPRGTPMPSSKAISAPNIDFVPVDSEELEKAVNEAMSRV